MAGNGGVYIQNLYEIQVLGTQAGQGTIGNDEAGSIYRVKAADVNASLGPGQWQAYDVWFKAARFAEGNKTSEARMTVVWNGRLVHNDVPVPGPTGSRAARGEPAPPEGSGPVLGPLLLQDHATAAEGPVRYRNVWIAPLFEERHTPGEWQDLLEKASTAGVPKGWTVRGGEATFRVDPGPVVVGTSKPDTPNTFLVAPGEWQDFELLLEFKLDPRLNSGIQVRSHVIGGPDNRAGGLRGPQVELDPGERAYTGGLYDEQRRGWLYRLIDAPYARRAFKPDEWNHLRVVATGPVVRTWVNGVPAAEVFDAMDARGMIALQVHGVGNNPEPMEARFRAIRIRELQRRKQASGMSGRRG